MAAIFLAIQKYGVSEMVRHRVCCGRFGSDTAPGFIITRDNFSYDKMAGFGNRVRYGAKGFETVKAVTRGRKVALHVIDARENSRLEDVQESKITLSTLMNVTMIGRQ
jgi:hypothetical protein